MELHCAYNQLVCVSDLKPHPKNPNTHSAAQVAAIAAVIEGNRSRAPITVSNRSGFITRGHGRLEAAALLGCDQFPVDFQDYASEEAELADNHLAELAEIDEDRLVGVLKELQAAGHDVGLAGFTEDEVARLIAVEEEIAQLEPIPKMELQAFEHYDYLVFMFKDIRDWLRVLQLLKVTKVDFSISRKSQKIGIGRVINGKTLLDRLDDSPRHHVAGPERPRGDAQVSPRATLVVPENEIEAYLSGGVT